MFDATTETKIGTPDSLQVGERQTPYNRFVVAYLNDPTVRRRQARIKEMRWDAPIPPEVQLAAQFNITGVESAQVTGERYPLSGETQPVRLSGRSRVVYATEAMAVLMNVAGESERIHQELPIAVWGDVYEVGQHVIYHGIDASRPPTSSATGAEVGLLDTRELEAEMERRRGKGQYLIGVLHTHPTHLGIGFAGVFSGGTIAGMGDFANTVELSFSGDIGEGEASYIHTGAVTHKEGEEVPRVGAYDFNEHTGTSILGGRQIRGSVEKMPGYFIAHDGQLIYVNCWDPRKSIQIADAGRYDRVTERYSPRQPTHTNSASGLLGTRWKSAPQTDPVRQTLATLREISRFR